MRSFIWQGWNDQVKGKDVFKPYYDRRHELTVEYDCVLWGTRVIVPERLRRDVLNLLHSTHQGIVAVKALARSYIWWPKLNEDIENTAKTCEPCQTSQRNPVKTIVIR